jgi:hypothetical protein
VSILLALHVVAGILFVGPVAVTTSLFPRFVPLASSDSPGTAADTGERNVAAARILARVTRVYGTLALIVPAAGLVLAGLQGRLTEVWVVLAMVLTAVAGALLVLRITPAQQDALAAPATPDAMRTMRMLVGVFNLLWVTVVVLMIVRPGADR